MKDMGKVIISIQFLIYAINIWLDLVRIVLYNIRLCGIAHWVGYIGCQMTLVKF